jgi:hypothetical protein
MMRTQPPWFRWAAGGFALIAAIGLAVQWRSTGDRADLLLAGVCLVAAGYWLIFDRHPADADEEHGNRDVT